MFTQGTAVIHVAAGGGIGDLVFSDVAVGEYLSLVTLEHVADVQ